MRLSRLIPVMAVLSAACAASAVDLARQAPATLAQEPRGYESGVVERVIDGDTAEIEITARAGGPGAGAAGVGETYSVRFIGIDTPESVRPGWPVECFGREASAAAKALLEGQEVRLVKDIEESDRYDRLLRYVYLGHEMANARLVLNGYASAYPYPPNVRHNELFVQLQSEARAEDRGLWASDTCNGEQ